MKPLMAAGDVVFGGRSDHGPISLPEPGATPRPAPAGEA